MADVFISYKREELARAALVAQALSEEGFTAFYDLHEDGIHAGEQWDRRLEAELQGARCCVVLWSAASVASDNVRSEARRAHNRGILVPAKLDACTPPIGLDSLQEADLRAWRGDRADPQWRFLVDRGVARKVGRPGRAPPLGGREARVRRRQPRTFPQRSSSTGGRGRRWFIPAALAGVVALFLVAFGVTRLFRLPSSANNSAATLTPDPSPSTGGRGEAEPAAPETVADPAAPVDPAAPETVADPAAPPVQARADQPIPRPEMMRIPGRNFEVGRYEVTFAEWDVCVAGGGCNGYRPDDQGWGRGRRPVINVSWNDAQAFVQWLSRTTGQRYRLLTEAEWEYAARAGTTSEYSWGDDPPVCDQSARNGANFAECTDDRTRPVGSFQPNGFGLYDVHGNVGEWVEDAEGSSRVLRGGSWINNPLLLRSAYRGGFYPSVRNYDLGFRLARTV